MAARAAVEALLRERKLDRTLTSTLARTPGRRRGCAAWRLTPWIVRSAGGLPRGQVSEVVGPASSGRTSLAWAALAAATRRGESVALDRYLRPFRSAHGGTRAALSLSRLLWVRGQAVSKTSGADRSGVAAGRARGGRPRHVRGARDRSRAEVAQPGRAVARVHAGRDRSRSTCPPSRCAGCRPPRGSASSAPSKAAIPRW